MYVIELKKGHFFKSIGWVTTGYAYSMKLATQFKSKSDASQVINLYGLNYNWFPKIRKVSNV
jgi:hypothetical protein